MKVLLRFLLMVVLVSYLFVSFFFLRSYAAEDKCRDLQVEITDSAVLHYISPADVYNYIEDFEMEESILKRWSVHLCRTGCWARSNVIKK